MPPENECEEPLIEISERQVQIIESVASKLRSCFLMARSGRADAETWRIFNQSIDELDGLVVDLVEPQA